MTRGRLGSTLKQPATHAPAEVIGHHGCTLTTARHVLNGESFAVSQNAHDWLGNGVYFWEYAPARAANWAKSRFPGKKIAVLQATIFLGDCLNLLDVRHHNAIAAVFNRAVEKAAAEGRPFPQNRPNGQNFRDRLVIELFCREWIASGGAPFQTVRGCYPEGAPIFQQSQILSLTHAQVAVRDPSCISNIRLVDWRQQ